MEPVQDPDGEFPAPVGPEHPPPGTPTAWSPYDAPERPLAARDVPALLPKLIG
jgi:hypothetical protein